MLGDQRLRVNGGTPEGRQSRRFTQVSQRDAGVAQQATAFGAHDWCTSEFLFEAGLVEGEQFQKVGLMEVGSRAGLHGSSRLRKAVPWADGKAIVAAKNAIADGGSELDRDGAFQFNGQVRNTTARVELERSG